MIELDGPEGRHAAVVRRIRVGEALDLTDGRGSVASCTVAEVSKTGLICAVRSRRVEPAASPGFVVVQALAKGDRAERAVEMLTEVGVDVIVPWAADRSVARWRGEREAKALSRWRSTAYEAAKQSRRTWFPIVAEPATTTQVCGLLANVALPLVLHEGATASPESLTVPTSGDVVIVVGPEGGIGDEEIATLADAGGRPVRLGRSVMRTSTAGVVAVSALMSRTARWG
jgi:16S rRNA (uracil1498-N3)-methyltransferase